jgi:hypothetical protein
MSIVPVSILSSEQVVKVKHMFDETIIEKLNLLMHSHAIAEKDTKQHRELANFKERCEDEYNKDKCRVSADDAKESIIINQTVAESMGEEGNRKDELLRYRETLLLQFLEYNKKKKLKSHLFVVFGGKVEDNQVYDKLYDDGPNNNWVYRMNVEDNMNKLPTQFEGLYNKIKDKFIEYKVAKQKPAYTINDNDKPFESIVFLKASKSNYSIDFSRDKNIKTMPALLSKFDKEISFSKGQSKKLDEEIQKFVNKHNKYDFASNEQKIVDDRNSTTGTSEIMAMDLVSSRGSSSFQDLVKAVDVNNKDLRNKFIKYVFNSRKELFTETKKQFLFKVFSSSNTIGDETIEELSNLANLNGRQESITTYFHRMSIYLLQKYFNFYVLKQPMMSDMFPLVSKDMKSFQINVNINYISKVKKDYKYYDKHIVPTDLKYPETNQNKTRGFHFKITDKEREEYTIQSIGSMIGNNLYPVEIVKKPGNKEVPIKYSMILKTKDLPLMVELELQEKNTQDNEKEKIKEKIKGLLFVDEAIQTTDKTLHEMKPSKIYPTNKANHFFHKPKFEANQNALADYLKKPKISADEYKKKLCEVFTSKENLSKFFVFCQNNSKYIYLTEKSEDYNSKLSVLRCLLQPNSCYYHKKKTMSIEDEAKSKVNSNKTSKGETDQTTSQCNYTIHSVDYLNPNIKDLDEKKAIKDKKKRDEEEEKKREDEMFFKEIKANIEAIKEVYEKMISIPNVTSKFKKLKEELAYKEKSEEEIKQLMEDNGLKAFIMECIPDNQIGFDIRIQVKIPKNKLSNDISEKYDNAVKSLRDALKRITLSSSGKCVVVSLGSPDKKKCSEYSNKGEEKKEEKEIDIIIHVFRTPEKKQGSKDKPETCETRQSVLKQVVKGTWNNLTRKAKLLGRQRLMAGGKRRTIRHNKRMKKNKKNVKRTRKRQRQNKRLHRTRKAKTTHAGRG